MKRVQLPLPLATLTVATRSITSARTTVGDITVTPEGRMTLIRTPFFSFIRMRPTAVLVQRPDRSERLPIRDTTRLLQAGVLVLGFLIAAGIQRYVLHVKEQQP